MQTIGEVDVNFGDRVILVDTIVVKVRDSLRLGAEIQRVIGIGKADGFGRICLVFIFTEQVTGTSGRDTCSTCGYGSAFNSIYTACSSISNAINSSIRSIH